MQIGDPKKTAILALVAVGALGFCAKQLLFAGGTPHAMRQADSGAESSGEGDVAASGMVVATTVEDLRVDPFSNPKLAVKPSSTTDAGAIPAPPSPIASKPNSPFLPLPGATGIEKIPPDQWPNPVDPGQTEPPTPGDVKVEKVTQVTLKAIVKVNRYMAYLSVDGQEARGFRPGDLIKNDLQVAFVNDDSVILKSSKTTVTLKVGQQGDLK